MSMKILSLEATNYKSLEALFLELDGHNLKVAGTTGQGKTTAISLFWEILETVGDPIRHEGKQPGAKALLRVVFGSPERRYIAERKYTAGGTDISIRSEDGKTKVSAKEFKSWFSSLAVNPHKLMSLGPQDRTAALLRAARMPEGVDLEAIDRDRAAAHEAREDARKEKTRLSQDIGIRPREVVRVDVAASAARLMELRTDEATGRASLRSRVEELERLDQEVKDAEARLEALRARRAEVEQIRAGIDTYLRENVDPAEIERLDQEVARADEINGEAALFERWTEANKRLDLAEAKFTEHDRAVKACEERKRAALDAVVWPLPGLSVQDGEVYYKGIPLVQAGESEQLLVCGSLAAHEIGQAKLRVVRLDGIESMSSEDFATLERIFSERDIQVLASRVTRGDLEDGEILIHGGKVQEVSA